VLSTTATWATTQESLETVFIHCDNIEVVRQTRHGCSLSKAGEALQADYDVLKQICVQQDVLRKLIPKLMEGTHVKGHQDRHMTFAQLSRPAQLNVLADDRATEAMWVIKQDEAPRMIPFDQCTAIRIWPCH
jgi:hypothetical protein